jgi:hypothetical protein
MVSAAWRFDAAGLAAALNCTCPGPDPLAPLVTVSQPASLAAVHAQPAATATDAVPDPPAASNVWAGGVTTALQFGGVGADWVTVTFCPAIETLPLRPLPLAATLSVTVPFPVPLAPLTT